MRRNGTRVNPWKFKLFWWLEKAFGHNFYAKYQEWLKKSSHRSGGRVLLPRSSKNELCFPEGDGSRISIGEEDAWRIFYFAAERQTEISLLMHVAIKDGTVFLDKPLFPVQSNHYFRTDMDESWLAKYSLSLPFEERAWHNTTCNLWIHSHLAGGRVRWSNYDDMKIEQLIGGKKYLISIVVLPRNGTLFYRCRIDLSVPFRMKLDDVPIAIISRGTIDHNKLKEEMNGEYNTKVTQVETAFGARMGKEDVDELDRLYGLLKEDDDDRR